MVDRVASTTSYVASAVAVVGSLDVSGICMIGGLAVAVVTMIVNMVFKYKMLKIAEKKGVNITKDND